MIIKIVDQNVLETGAKNIVFAINKEGHNDFRFAGEIANKY